MTALCGATVCCLVQVKCVCAVWRRCRLAKTQECPSQTRPLCTRRSSDVESAQNDALTHKQTHIRAQIQMHACTCAYIGSLRNVCFNLSVTFTVRQKGSEGSAKLYACEEHSCRVCISLSLSLPLYLSLYLLLCDDCSMLLVDLGFQVPRRLHRPVGGVELQVLGLDVWEG